MVSASHRHGTRLKYSRTFFVPWQTPEAVPSGNKDHVVPKIFALNLGFLKDDDICFQDLKHGLELSLVSPGLVLKRITDPIHCERDQ